MVDVEATDPAGAFALGRRPYVPLNHARNGGLQVVALHKDLSMDFELLLGKKYPLREGHLRNPQVRNAYDDNDPG